MAGNSRPIDARGWIFEVEDADAGTETWLPVLGITTFTVNPGENEEVADTTAFDSEGQYSQDVMQRGATLSLEGQYRIDKTTKAQDPGQAYIDTVWANLLGIESQNRIRYRHTSQTKWAIWDATVTPGEQGGGTNEKTTWSATITRCGAATVADVVVSP
ncbi:phage tail tube protein [Streptomyces sp. NPDC058783]|uniref:phage tail tube protein n=1 Tax=Streptomyces sp. NPDC058783 TaxID=3346633 RepID=UPI003698FE92